MLVVPGPNAGARLPLQGVSEVEVTAEDHAGGSAERDREAKAPVGEPGPARRRKVHWSGGPGLPFFYGRGKDGRRRGRERRRE